MNLEELITPVVNLAEEAGRAILEVYATDFDVQSKADDSPVTQADLAAHRRIVAGLEALTPDVPIISEECGLPSFELRRTWPQYWLVDPLDGTREFVNKNGEFTVNIALIEGRRPVFGVVHVPVQARTYLGCEGYGAELRVADTPPDPIHVAETSGERVRVVGSRSHRGKSLEAFIAALGDCGLVPELVAMGSSLKFCIIAEGRADVYPRLGPTSEWDTAAAQAVVEQAGGAVLRLDGKPLSYNEKEQILNPDFVVVGPADRDWLALIPKRE